MSVFRERGTAAFEPRDPADRAPRVDLRPPRRGWFRRRRNQRVVIARRSPLVVVVEALRAAGATVAFRLAFFLRVVAALAFIVGAVFAGQRVVRHVVASPRFALREIRADATLHVSREDIVSLSGVAEGDQLLAVDTDAVAARVAKHPWVSTVRVKRQLPGALVIEVVERRAFASALLGTLYLLDETGRPFKRATLDEADGLPVFTGIGRETYTLDRLAAEAAYREALGLLAAYQSQDDVPAARRTARPALSEIHIDARAGYSLVLFDGGAEVRLGRGDWPGKLARLDEILGALGPRGPSALRAVHLDGATLDRVAVRLAPAQTPG